MHLQQPRKRPYYVQIGKEQTKAQNSDCHHGYPSRNAIIARQMKWTFS